MRLLLTSAMLLLAAVVFLVAARERSAEEHAPPSLQARLEARIAEFDGVVGVYVRHLESGETVEIRADELFPTASLIKVPILVGVFDRLEAGELEYLKEYPYDPKWSRGGEDIVAKLTEGSELPLAKVVLLMITASDNTGSLWCQELAGTGTAINELLAASGFEQTRVNSRTPGREKEYERWGWGQTTPREMTELLIRIRAGEMISPAASEEMYRCLTRIYWNDEALSQIPPTVQVASKQGAIRRSRSEVLLVNARHGDYAFSVITRDQADESWKPDNAGFVLLRDISRLLWEYFEPNSSWRPAPGTERYQ